MRVRNSVLLVLVLAIGGALGLSATVGLTLWELKHAAETSGHASEDFQLAETFVSNSSELLAVMDILTSESSGVFLIGDRLVERCRANLKHLLRSSAFSGKSLVTRVSDTFEEMVDAGTRAAISESSAGKEKTLEEFDAIAASYVALIEDLEREAGTIAAQQIRELEERRAQALRRVLSISALYLALIVFVRRWLTKRLVQPLQRLAGAAKQAMTEDSPFTLQESGPAEVRTVTRSISAFVETLETRVRDRTAELEKVHRQLVDASRRDGMAEVATNVLHNVGNVLNSVNVSAGLLTEKMRSSKAPNLARAVALMGEHKDDLGAFLTEDERGSRLPGYLVNLGEHLAREQADTLNELGSLSENVEHIKAIVATQQGYAKAVAPLEPVSLSDLVEDALRLNAAALSRHEVQVVRELVDLPPIVVDRHKVLQILVNLVQNAKQALDEANARDRRLTVRITRAANERVRIEISDNGIGIQEQHLTKIFAYGFSTKKDGHGFGLHGSALAAKEMGGSLRSHSDGPGQGATFALDLPLKTAEVTQ